MPSLSRAKTYWRLDSLTCALFTGGGAFELRLIDGDLTVQQERCGDSGEAFRKSREWFRTALRAANRR